MNPARAAAWSRVGTGGKGLWRVHAEGAVPPRSCWGSGAKPWLWRSLLVTHPRDTRGGEAAGDCARAAGPGAQFMAPGEK